MSGGDLSQFSMIDLFRLELESQSQSLTDGLLALERDPAAAPHLEACMRAAHSLKGAARIVALEAAVRVAHAMEDCLVAAQRGQIALTRHHIDTLLRGVDLLAAAATEDPEAVRAVEAQIEHFERALKEPASGQNSEPIKEQAGAAAPIAASFPSEADVPVRPAPPQVPSPLAARDEGAGRRGGTLPDGAQSGTPERMVRITAEAMSRLLGLAGETLMQARQLRPFADRLSRLGREQDEVLRSFDHLRLSLGPLGEQQQVADELSAFRDRLVQGREALADRMDEMEKLDRHGTDLANRLHGETLDSRMCPFEDGVRHFSRMVRDLGRELGKSVRLDIVGGSTGIDRDILEQLEAPLGHLLRNAVDHGAELPEVRALAGKPPENVIRLEARHIAGLLQIIIEDDGCGVDAERLREAIIARGLATRAVAATLSEAERLEFLFLPGFSMKESVNDISGRGVGLDVVQAMVRQVRGQLGVTSHLGQGTRFQLQLPLTLSMMRTLMVDVAGEAYAFPLSGISHALKLDRSRIEHLEGRSHFRHGDRQVGLVTLHEILGLPEPAASEGELCVVLIGEGDDSYALVVDRFLGQHHLVVRPLDPRLAKIQDISAAALSEDGAPVLILDTDDLVRSSEKLAASGRLRNLQGASAGREGRRRKQILVVDDSLTVRELERKLLENSGYEVQVAVDGMDGWNTVRSRSFDLVVTDVDMPRMDGIELVQLIRQDARLRALPVMIVSYKDREEDRRRGLDAGADYYLTKARFHDDSLVQAVVDLVGPASG